MERAKTAYLTGGASGIACALASQLLSQGWHVFIADRNVSLAKQFAEQHNATSKLSTLHYAQCDTDSWESQLSAFSTALQTLGGRIDFIAPIAGIGEKKWLPTLDDMGRVGSAAPFVKPDLSVIDVDLTGVLYTVALAIQQFQRQEPILWSKDAPTRCKGKIGLVASVCGFYCVPSLPVYTAAKHALIGLTRSYGVLLQSESIMLSALAPNVVRTGISSDVFYNQMEEQGLLTPMESVLDAFNDIIGGGESGTIYECGPKGGWTKRPCAEYLDNESEQCCDLLLERGKKLHYDRSSAEA